MEVQLDRMTSHKLHDQLQDYKLQLNQFHQDHAQGRRMVCPSSGFAKHLMRNRFYRGGSATGGVHERMMSSIPTSASYPLMI